MEHRTIELTLEREGDHIRIVAKGVYGVNLAGGKHEAIKQSIIPVIQHVFWKNEKLCMMPVGELDFSALMERKKATIEFAPTDQMFSPHIPCEGEFWSTPDGRAFFVPFEDGVMDETLLERIIASVEAEAQTQKM